MASISRTEINGVIDTSQNVLANINKIAASSQAFLSWDPTVGQWTTIINQSGSSVYTFDDSNIVGSITVSGSGINEIYNSVRVGFLNKDQRGDPDERVVSISASDRYELELDNELSLTFDLINDPAQAELLGAIELKQSRVDKIIEFATDYRAINLSAGDIIGVSNEMYFERSSANPKLFRIVSIEEIDAEDGGIFLQITAIEYDDAVYSTSDLTREPRIINSGIIPKSENVCVILKDATATVSEVDYSLSNGGELVSTPNSFIDLINGVNDLYNELGGEGSLFEKIFNVFEDETGFNLLDVFSGSGGGSGVTADEVWSALEYTKVTENINGVCVDKITSITFITDNGTGATIKLDFDISNATDVS
jgi:hypothetical protein